MGLGVVCTNTVRLALKATVRAVGKVSIVYHVTQDSIRTCRQRRLVSLVRLDFMPCMPKRVCHANNALSEDENIPKVDLLCVVVVNGDRNQIHRW